jgi:hypothetical protein
VRRIVFDHAFEHLVARLVESLARAVAGESVAIAGEGAGQRIDTACRTAFPLGLALNLAAGHRDAQGTDPLAAIAHSFNPAGPRRQQWSRGPRHRRSRRRSGGRANGSGRIPSIQREPVGINELCFPNEHAIVRDDIQYGPGCGLRGIVGLAGLLVTTTASARTGIQVRHFHLHHDRPMVRKG